MYENIQLIKVKLFQGYSVQWTRSPVGTFQVILFYMCAFNYLVLQQLSTSSTLEVKKNFKYDYSKTDNTFKPFRSNKIQIKNIAIKPHFLRGNSFVDLFLVILGKPDNIMGDC